MKDPFLTLERLRPWMMETLLPFWADVGVDRQDGGFVERLTLDGRPALDDYKRVRVQARQIYVFSHAHLLGAPHWALSAVNHGVDFLFGRCWDAKQGGWYHLVTKTGEPLDRRKDTYDHAFVLLAMAWLYRATADPAAIEWANTTMRFLDDRLADPATGSFWEDVAPDGSTDRLPRRQNPHMHLLEAFLMLFEATGDSAWMDRAKSMVGLLRARFFDADTGTLIEFFRADLQPAPGMDGQIREPGHHLEWVWLLLQYRRVSGDDSVLELISAFYQFGNLHGFDDGRLGVPMAFDAVGADGTVITDTKRLWPQTEAVKAHLACHEFRRSIPGELAAIDPGLAAELNLMMVFAYIDLRHGPLWHDQFARDGTPVAEFVPASTLYHLVLCFAETLRVLGGGPNFQEQSPMPAGKILPFRRPS